jgi:maltodextrin utilization protein YvdJ
MAFYVKYYISYEKSFHFVLNMYIYIYMISTQYAPAALYFENETTYGVSVFNTFLLLMLTT